MHRLTTEGGLHVHTFMTKTGKRRTLLGFLNVCVMSTHTFLFFFSISPYTCSAAPRSPAPLPSKGPKMTPSHLFTSAQDFSFSELYDHIVSSPVDDLVSGPLTPFEEFLLFPATIPYTANNRHIESLS